MAEDIIISSEGLSKKYLIGHQAERQHYLALRDVIAQRVRSAVDMARGRGSRDSQKTEEFWALNDVSFEVRRGEVLGIIGRNGAGKSTLLKILSRITEPTEGRVRIRGRVASLLEVGTGFHQELTGRENIYLNGAILGMSRAEIKRKFDEIVAFAEVEKFLDTPVKRYSSGMYVRLAFAVAAHLEPEILVVDEVLAVGDAEFQKKCLGKMSEVASGGRTVLFVSHNMGAVSALTERCLYLERGRITESGPTALVVSKYLGITESGIDYSLPISHYRRNRNPDADVHILEVRAGVPMAEGCDPNVDLGAAIEIQLRVRVIRQLHEAHVVIHVKNSNAEVVATLFSPDNDFALSLPPGEYSITVRPDGLNLTPGYYIADIGIGPSVDALSFDVLLNIPMFEVQNENKVTRWLARPWGHIHCPSANWTSILLPTYELASRNDR